MFILNESHRQQGLFGSNQFLPKKVRSRLAASWANTFYREVFCLIDEAPFSVLYSELKSRPNAPVNVLIGLEILKEGFGWSDEELYDRVLFDLQVRHALGLDDLSSPVFELRTLYNFRRRVRQYAEQTGINLYEVLFATITDKQLEALEVKTQWQRMDSTQVLSNLALMNRLELIISVVQQGYKALDDSVQSLWKERLSFYLEGRAQSVSQRIRKEEIAVHFEFLGPVLVDLVDALEGDVSRMIERVLREQYEVIEGERTVLHLRPGDQVSSESLQSPFDEDATYRLKGNEGHRGYVVNVSETCEGELKLITDVEVAPNATDDAVLLTRSLDRQAERGIEVDRMTVDGGYTGPVSEKSCERHGVELRPTNMRGGTSRSGRMGWEAYQWIVDEAGLPVRIVCPAGMEAEVKPGKKANRFVVHFSGCSDCPLFGTSCRVSRKGKRRVLHFNKRVVEVALMRQGIREEDKSLRAAVEATMRSIKYRYAGGKLRVRGLIRASMVFSCSALMVNLRRIHAYYQRRVNTSQITDFLRRFCSMIGLLRRFTFSFGGTKKRSPILAK